MAFNLAEMLKESAPAATTETMQPISLDLIDEDGRNFYSLSGIDDLAANIELCGLLDPIRVRRAEGGRFIVVSGHRRRAACVKLRDEGNDRFKTVPCIVETGGSEAMQELRLIYANSSTRVLSSADLQQQAARVTELLYKLKSEGVEFPGRMSTHVADACSISETKLKRLNAIKNNLYCDFYTEYQNGNINETAAYALSRLPLGIQTALSNEKRIRNLSEKKDGIRSNKVEECIKRGDDYNGFKHCLRDRQTCEHNIKRYVATICNNSYWDCPGGCCCTCSHLDECPVPCKHAKAQRDSAKAEAKAKEEARKASAAEAKATEEALLRIRHMEQVQRLAALADRAGLEDDEFIKIQSWCKVNIGELRKLAERGLGDKFNAYYEDYILLHCGLADLERLADQLKCTVGELAGETVPSVSTVDTSTWRDGRPSSSGMYYCKFDCGGTVLHNAAYYSDTYDEFAFRRGGAKIEATLLGWVPLPED